MSNNLDVLLVGCGYMAGEYTKVLQDMDVDTIVVGRSKENAEKFSSEYSIDVIYGGIEWAVDNVKELPEYAIVTVGVEELHGATSCLLDVGVKNILVEKPGGIDEKEVSELDNLAREKNAKVFVAYNRRFYQSTRMAKKIVEEDGGIISINFEFTEWERDILSSIKSEKVRENILLANSSHVIDLALYFGGEPVNMSSYVSGKLDWHKNGCVYSGAGYTNKGVIFSYLANWGAPGRWSLELMTAKHRLYFKPMERLGIQELNSVVVNEYDMDYSIDSEYKPGIYEEVKTFLFNQKDDRLVTIQEQRENIEVYMKIAGVHKESVRI